jgi:hypothetical protein
MPVPRPRATRAIPTAPAVPKLTTTRLLAILAAEGFYVTRRMLYSAAALGYVDLPPRAGNQRRWTAEHLEGLRQYLRHHSRSQADDVIGGCP